MTNLIKKTSDSFIDTLETLYTPTTRAGLTLNRTGQMHASGVSKEVIALQLTANSNNKHEYTENDVDAYLKLYKDTQTRVGITKSQATALIKDQNNYGFVLGSEL